jgi:hypothetical protein
MGKQSVPIALLRRREPRGRCSGSPICTVYLGPNATSAWTRGRSDLTKEIQFGGHDDAGFGLAVAEGYSHGEFLESCGCTALVDAALAIGAHGLLPTVIQSLQAAPTCKAANAA